MNICCNLSALGLPGMCWSAVLAGIALLTACCPAPCRGADAAKQISLHLSPQGDDANPGTPERPRRSLQQIDAWLQASPAITEVVLHAGVYHGGATIQPLKDVPEAATSPLLIRAAEGAEAVLDGAGPSLDAAAPVAGAPGVFVLTYKHSHRQAPALWESDTRIRYVSAADLAAVAHFPASYCGAGENGATIGAFGPAEGATGARGH